MSVPRLSLVLAAAGMLFTAAVAQSTITVQPQETLWTLARRHGTTIEAIKAANNLSSDSLQVYQQLVLPEGALVASEPANPAAAAVPAAAAPVSAPVLEVSSEVVQTPVPTYTVQPGDSLFNIASTHGLTLTELMAINGLKSDVINAGQILKVAGQSSGPLTIIIQPGESLTRIAERFGITPTQLASANQVGLHTVLNAGHPLIIPDASYVAGDLTSGPDIGGAAGPEIVVQPGDSLWQIARLHNTTVDALREVNGLNGDSLRPGMTLRLLPGGTPGAAPAASVPAAGDGMVWPLPGIITSRFGYRSLRIGGTNMHYGLDLDGDTGEPIVAAIGGVVTFSGWRGGYGNLVIIEENGVEHYYAHASELLVSVGSLVNTGQVIARVGTTGNVTGAHLHYEVRVNGTPVDPLPLLEARAGAR